MSDIVEELRSGHKIGMHQRLCRAADEIERLMVRNGQLQDTLLFKDEEIGDLTKQLVKDGALLRELYEWCCQCSDFRRDSKLSRDVYAALTDDHQSAPVSSATHNSGEGEPAVTPASAGADTISEHIGWLKQYIAGMNSENWEDMRLRAERQLHELSAAVTSAYRTTKEN